VTRDTSSDKAQAIGNLPGVELVTFDLDKPDTLFGKESPYAVFSVQNTMQPDEAGQGG